jgi:hypothetical protein
VKLWRSGVILSAAGFLAGLGNYVFQAIISRQITQPAEWGYVSSTLAFINFLGLPLSVVGWSLVHYIAHFRATNDEARLRGLLSGVPKFLLKATVVGSVLAVLLANPLSRFFNFPRASLMLVALVCVLVGLWSGLATLLCQGMAWFKRLAVVGIAAVALRLAFGWIMTAKYPTAEVAVSATTFSLLANLAVLYWWNDLFTKGDPISPWNRDFARYVVLAAAYVGGMFFFTGDQLVAQRYFPKNVLDAYSAAGMLSRALAQVVGPFLVVLFTSRSGHKTGPALGDQRILLGLFAVCLAGGALGLLLLKDLLLKFLGKYSVQSSMMMGQFTLAMAFVGLNQAIATWTTASRWFKLTLLYGVLGLAYWLLLLVVGTTPERLLRAMPLAGGAAFAILLPVWVFTARRAHPVQPDELDIASAPAD